MDFVKKDDVGNGSVSSGGSANQDDFEDEDSAPINGNLGRTVLF